MMHLSEAMRLGALTCKQGYTEYFEYDLTGEPRAACALGAALIAVGGQDVINAPFYDWTGWDKLFDVKFRRRTPCPGNGCVGHAAPLFKGTVYEVIIHLNDDHNWTREDIASWVETVEKVHASEKPIQTYIPDAASATSGEASC